MCSFRQKDMARPPQSLKGFRRRATHWMTLGLDALIEQMCGISMLCLLILLTLGFMFFFK